MNLEIWLMTTHFVRRHNINTGMFLASLSVAELLFLFVYLPLELTKDVLTQEMRGGGVCKVKEFIKMLTALATVINLAAVSVERYQIKIIASFKTFSMIGKKSWNICCLSKSFSKRFIRSSLGKISVES